MLEAEPEQGSEFQEKERQYHHRDAVEEVCFSIFYCCYVSSACLDACRALSPPNSPEYKLGPGALEIFKLLARW